MYLKIGYDLTTAGHQFCVQSDCSATSKTQQMCREGKGNANHKRKGVQANPTARVSIRVLQEPGQSESHLDADTAGCVRDSDRTLRHFCQDTETTA